MRLNKISVESFKKVAKIELDLSDVNILVGPNGCGKSSIIQALHLASCVLRQADRVDKTKTSTVEVHDLDYLPTDDYKMLGHGALWGNNQHSPSSRVELNFQDAEGASFAATCTLRSARNAGISITGNIPTELKNILRGEKKFFSAYIPGISGIPNKEEKRAKKVVFKACSYGDSNVILRNVLLLLNERDKGNIALIENWIKDIIGRAVKIIVEHDDNRDLFIRCDLGMGGISRPLELIGTGYLQLIQIFSYVLLFEPGVLLIDEPDIHLHPSAQEQLVQVLAKIARERNIRILLTTHSPFIVRGAPVGTQVYWLQEGVVNSKNREQVELALGWGVFGKRIIMVSEDSKTLFLRKILGQWPDLEKSVAFLPGNGYKAVPTPEQAAQLFDALGGKYKIVIHRDRDSLSLTECEILKNLYAAKGATLWLTDSSDIEAYFCIASVVSSISGCPLEEARNYIDSVLTQHSKPIREQFDKQRIEHNKEVYKTGGSPTNEDVWTELQATPLKGAKGKYVFGHLKTKCPSNRFSEESVLGMSLPVEIAPSLKQILATLGTT